MKLPTILALAMLMLSACSFLQPGNPGAELTVKCATIKVIDGNHDRADRVASIASAVLDRLDNSPQRTIQALVRYVRGKIRWDSLDAADTVLVDALLDELQRRLIARYGDGPISPEARLGAQTVAQWVLQASRL